MRAHRLDALIVQHLLQAHQDGLRAAQGFSLQCACASIRKLGNCLP